MTAGAATERTVYIAGPMARRPEFNFPAFEAAAKEWRARGFTVISPHEHDLDAYGWPHGATGFESPEERGFDIKSALLWDLQQVAEADIIVLLEGWRASRGAIAELALAANLGLTAFDVQEKRWARAETLMDEVLLPKELR